MLEELKGAELLSKSAVLAALRGEDIYGAGQLRMVDKSQQKLKPGLVRDKLVKKTFREACLILHRKIQSTCQSPAAIGTNNAGAADTGVPEFQSRFGWPAISSSNRGKIQGSRGPGV